MVRILRVSAWAAFSAAFFLLPLSPVTGLQVIAVGLLCSAAAEIGV